MIIAAISSETSAVESSWVLVSVVASDSIHLGFFYQPSSFGQLDCCDTSHLIVLDNCLMHCLSYCL